jgi:hypothetical protein
MYKRDSDYTFGIFWTLCCLFFFDIQILITPLVSFGHYVVCSSLIYRFWLHLWYLLDIMLSVLLWYTDSDYTFGIFCTLCCLFFFDLHILITPSVSFGLCVVLLQRVMPVNSRTIIYTSHLSSFVILHDCVVFLSNRI